MKHNILVAELPDGLQAIAVDLPDGMLTEWVANLNEAGAYMFFTASLEEFMEEDLKRATTT